MTLESWLTWKKSTPPGAGIWREPFQVVFRNYIISKNWGFVVHEYRAFHQKSSSFQVFRFLICYIAPFLKSCLCFTLTQSISTSILAWRKICRAFKYVVGPDPKILGLFCSGLLHGSGHRKKSGHLLAVGPSWTETRQIYTLAPKFVVSRICEAFDSKSIVYTLLLRSSLAPKSTFLSPHPQIYLSNPNVSFYQEFKVYSRGVVMYNHIHDGGSISGVCQALDTWNSLSCVCRTGWQPHLWSGVIKLNAMCWELWRQQKMMRLCSSKALNLNHKL